MIETASSGRAKCRGCDQKIAKDELRFGERQPNAFGEGEMTLWFHPRCAAYKRPEPFLEAVAAHPEAGFEDLAAAARFGIAHRRVPRINGAERAPTGRARCRKCRELIEKDEWRIALVFFEEFRFLRADSCMRDARATTSRLQTSSTGSVTSAPIWIRRTSPSCRRLLTEAQTESMEKGTWMAYPVAIDNPLHAEE